jgi:hypothetical protein
MDTYNEHNEHNEHNEYKNIILLSIENNLFFLAYKVLI